MTDDFESEGGTVPSGRLRVRVTDNIADENALALEIPDKEGNTMVLISRKLMRIVEDRIGYKPEPEQVAISLFKTEDRPISEQQEAQIMSDIARRKGRIH